MSDTRVVIKRGNDQTATLKNLRTATKPVQYLNAATATATLYDGKGQVVRAYQNITMSYVPSSTGHYKWLIEGQYMMLPKGSDYQLEIKAVESGLNFRTVVPVSVVD